MANSFDQLNEYKKQVLQEVADLAYQGKITEATPNETALKIINYQRPKVRCCVYKEREVIRERTYLAMGRSPDGSPAHKGQFVYVLEAACDDCTIHRVRITDNCRKCLFRPCTKACHFGAIYEGVSKMHIAYDKCRACTMCAKACPYGSILVSDRPCHKACPTGALKYIENEIAQISEPECVNCGRCSASCPFGAISEISFVVPVIDEMRKGKKVVAMVAPAIVGQWGGANLKQVYDALYAIGFTDILEVAQGADLTTKFEAEEALEAKKQGIHITTSCCPAFVSLVQKMSPEVYMKHTSDVLSPMAITARMARQLYPGAINVFIGPCVAKKAEKLLKKNKDNIDYVLTFEEINAMMKAKNVDPSKMEGKAQVANGSYSGRNFCNTGGVATSLNDYLAEEGNPTRLTLKIANGSAECVQFVKDLASGKQQEDVLEGMMCEGGCMAGVDSQANNLFLAKSHGEKENISAKDTKIADAAKKFSVDCHFDKSDN
jgi:ferredoxin hydrogenase large subunit